MLQTTSVMESGVTFAVVFIGDVKETALLRVLSVTLYAKYSFLSMEGRMEEGIVKSFSTIL